MPATKDEVLKLLEETRAKIIQIGRRGFAEKLLACGFATADDAHKHFEKDGFPEGINPVCLGAVTRPFIKGKWIVKDGYVLSQRTEHNHSREITRWRLLNREAVEAFVSTLPPAADSMPVVDDSPAVQGSLFGG